MGLFIIKLTLTPLLMWLLSYSSRRWGAGLGGLLSGLPLTSGPISAYLLIEQGREFAARSAISSIAGVGAISIFWLLYGVSARRYSVPLCALIALSVFVLEMVLLHPFHLALWPALTANLLIISATLWLVPKPRPDQTNIRYPRWDLPARMIAATGMVLLITFAANLLGPNLSGLLSPIPVLALPLCIFAHIQQGSNGALAVARGNLQAAYGVTAFYAVVALMIPTGNLLLTYVLALSSSLAATVPWLHSRASSHKWKTPH
jgi:hypothetical protein